MRSIFSKTPQNWSKLFSPLKMGILRLKGGCEKLKELVHIKHGLSLGTYASSKKKLREISTLRGKNNFDHFGGVLLKIERICIFLTINFCENLQEYFFVQNRLLIIQKIKKAKILN